MSLVFSIQRPAAGEFPVLRYFANYIELVTENDLLHTLQTSMEDVTRRYQSLKSPEQAEFRYAEGKWSLKEVLGHLIDTERIFAYRALCIARGEKTSLPGFDENDYVAAAGFDTLELSVLLESYQLTRQSNLLLFRNFSEEALLRRGVANGHEVSVRAIIAIIAGHERHHLNILAERYALV